MDVAVSHHGKLVVTAHIHHKRVVLDVVIILDTVQPAFCNQFHVYVIHPWYAVRLLALPSRVVPLDKCTLCHSCLDNLHEVILYK